MRQLSLGDPLVTNDRLRAYNQHRNMQDSAGGTSQLSTFTVSELFRPHAPSLHARWRMLVRRSEWDEHSYCHNMSLGPLSLARMFSE